MQAAIQKIRDGETITWEFPTRDLRSLKGFGWVGIGIGLFGVLFIALWMGIPMWWGVQALMGGQWFGLLFIAFAAFGLAGMRYAIQFLCGGLAILRNQTRCTVELSAKHLRVCEWLGGARLKREIELDNIQLLVLGDVGEVDPSYRAGNMLRASDLECLSAKLQKTKSSQQSYFPIVIGYPPEMLRQFGEVLVSETKDRQVAI
jgi:hypothetical protein